MRRGSRNSETMPSPHSSTPKPSNSTQRHSVRRALVLKQAVDFVKNEAILTNRAASYIQLKKYKEALFDCEQALLVNKTFVKAHQRAYKCYISLGDLEKALDSLNQAKALGDSTANQQLQVVKTVSINHFANILELSWLIWRDKSRSGSLRGPSTRTSPSSAINCSTTAPTR